MNVDEIEGQYFGVRQAEPSHLPRPESSSSKPLILYVEDDEDNWEVAELRLRSQYELLRASRAEEACRALRTLDSRLSLIMMDIELRGSDFSGVELAQLFRGELPVGRMLPTYARDLPLVSCPIIFVTAHSAQHNNVKLMLAGGERVISKPVDFQELRGALSKLTAVKPSNDQT